MMKRVVSMSRSNDFKCNACGTYSHIVDVCTSKNGKEVCWRCYIKELCTQNKNMHGVLEYLSELLVETTIMAASSFENPLPLKIKLQLGLIKIEQTLQDTGENNG